MILHRLVLLTLLLCTTYSCSAQEETENVYSIGEEVEFRVNFPCDPQIDTTDYLVHPSIRLTCAVDNISYELIATRYTDGQYSSDSLEDIEFDLDYTQHKFVSANQVSVISAVPKTISGYPGKEFRYQYTLKDRIRFTRCYIINQTLYSLIYEGPKKDAFHNKIDEYFDSFIPLEVDNLDPPYFSLPSEVSEDELPYEIEFPKRPKQRIDIAESFFGKAPLIMNLVQSDDPEGEYIALMTSYTPLPSSLSSRDSLRLLNDQRMTVSELQIDSELIKEKDLEYGREYISTYSIAGRKVRERRQVLIFGDNYLVVTGIQLYSQKRNEWIQQFFDSIELSL